MNPTLLEHRQYFVHKARLEESMKTSYKLNDL